MDQCSPRDQFISRQLANSEAVTPKSSFSRLPDEAFYTPYENSFFETPGTTDRFYTPSERTSSKLNLPVRVYGVENDLQSHDPEGRVRGSPMEVDEERKMKVG